MKNRICTGPITGTNQDTSRKKIHLELGLELFKSRRWHRSLSCLIKIMKEEAPNYLKNLIPTVNKPLEQGTTIYRNTAVK